MTDLNFDSFQRFMDASHTEEARKAQEEDSRRALVAHGRANDFEVEEEDGEGAESSVPPPLTRVGRQQEPARDDDPPRPARPDLTVEERWAALKDEHGTWGQKG